MSGQRACQLWGVLNVTPDSFSDGGDFVGLDRALAHARAMVAAGAEVVDVGGASSRPAGKAYGVGASDVSWSEELRRVEPVVKSLTESSIPVSIDTVVPEVAAASLAAGARWVNDVSCAASAGLLRVTADADAEYVLMHTRGDGAVHGDNVRYADLVADVLAELRAGVARAQDCGIAAERIWLDPGIGFAKTPEQSLQLLGAMASFVATGQRVIVGPSRKAFIAAAAARPDGTRPAPRDRQPGTDAAVTAAVLAGATAVRVHDVPASYQAVRVAAGIRSTTVEARP